MTTPDLPPNLPPLPPVPPGFDRWEYRGTRWAASGVKYAYFRHETMDVNDGWLSRPFDRTESSPGHYIEAVREPSAQLFATLDPENGEDQHSRVEMHLQWLESVRPGWAQEIRECMATGLEKRVCGGMSDRPTPETDAATLNKWQDSCPLQVVPKSLAVALERQRDEWMDRTTEALAEVGNLTQQRDAYAETLRLLRVECYDFIDQRHPELAPASPRVTRDREIL
jgi:hypothetical protein